MTRLQLLADRVATAVGGEVRLLPGDPPTEAAVALPARSVPILVRDYPRSCAVVVGARSWAFLEAADVDPHLPEIAAFTKAWADEHPDEVTLFEAATTLLAVLSAAFPHPWTANVPSPDAPKEIWLRAPDEGGGRVGLFPGKLVVWTASGYNELPCTTRPQLANAAAPLVALVRLQQDDHARNVERAQRLEAVAVTLMAALPPLVRDAHDWRSWPRYRPSSQGTVEIDLTAARPDGHRQRLVYLDHPADHPRIHAGLPAPDGWESDHPDLPAMAAAITLALRALTVDQLKVGRKYRVLAPLQSLRPGEVVTYKGFDDVDNHFGRYLFKGPDGHERAVEGDCSSPADGPLGAVHRYLQPL